MSERRIIAVVAVQKSDADDFIGKRFNFIHISESKTAPAAMAGEHQFDLPGKDAADAAHDFRNKRIAMFLPPCRPAFQIVFEIDDYQRAVSQLPAEETRLRSDVLNIKTGVIAWPEYLADYLLGAVPVR